MKVLPSTLDQLNCLASSELRARMPLRVVGLAKRALSLSSLALPAACAWLLADWPGRYPGASSDPDSPSSPDSLVLGVRSVRLITSGWGNALM